ncbi:hypothetical protein BDQ12DRAFT_642516 [Crucibulum laeve]|uniref:Uncharacterized protein n=1 Tax=Crucibulum laeve TaxID=68775 RepID=A0A5C3MGS3_9AGAR|nr:hypothetical protein BDQ12DRAFT_642516 [Crucibulum laeve]
MLFNIFAAAALAATSVLGSATPTINLRDESLTLNPPISTINEARDVPLSQLEARSLTNARRLAEGLPLNPPKRRTHTEVSRALPSGTPSNDVRQGIIQVFTGDILLGYVKAATNSFGEYGITADAAQALLVSVDVTDAATGVADIGTINGPDASYPFFGGIVGFSSSNDDLASGSFNYVYLGATTQTEPNSPPVDGANSFTHATSLSKKIESAIWTFDASTNTLTSQWINTDSSSPATFIGYYASDNVFILTGDKTTFTNNFGPTPWVTLKLVA